MKRAFRLDNARVDKSIDDFKKKFANMRANVDSHASLDTTILVHKIMDTVNAMSMQKRVRMKSF